MDLPLNAAPSSAPTGAEYEVNEVKRVLGLQRVTVDGADGWLDAPMRHWTTCTSKLRRCSRPIRGSRASTRPSTSVSSARSRSRSNWSGQHLATRQTWRMSYGCSLRALFTADSRYLAVERPKLEFEYIGHRLEISCLGAPLSEADQLFFVTHGFDTEESARRFGLSLRGHVRLLAVRGTLILDPGDELIVEPITALDRRQIEQNGKRAIDLQQGLVVFEESQCDHYVCAMGGSFGQGTTESMFREQFESVVQLPPALDGSRRALACDLLRSADADRVPRCEHGIIETRPGCRGPPGDGCGVWRQRRGLRAGVATRPGQGVTASVGEAQSAVASQRIHALR
jgi:hypothetical protein